MSTPKQPVTKDHKYSEILSLMRKRKNDYKDVLEDGVKARVSSDGQNLVYRSDTYGDLTMTKTAQQQFSAQLGIPYGFLRKCPPDEKVRMLNYWIPSKQARRRVALRTVPTKNLLCGINPKSFSPLDHVDILEASGFSGDSPVYVRGLQDSGEARLTMRFVTADLFDEWRCGFAVWNSDVGVGKFFAVLMLWKQICQNGMEVKVKGKTFYESTYRGAVTPQVTKDLFSLASKTVAANKEFLQKIVRKVEGSEKPKEEIMKELEAALEKNKLSTSYVDKILKRYSERDGSSELERVINATTLFAHTDSALSKQKDFESVASDLISAQIEKMAA